MKYTKTNLHSGLMARVQRKSDENFQNKINEATKKLMEKTEVRKGSLKIKPIDSPKRIKTRFLRGKR